MLSEVVDTEIKLLKHYEPANFYLAERFIKLKTAIPNFNKLFSEARSSSYCSSVNALFRSELAVERALDNFEIGLALIANKTIGDLVGRDITCKLKDKKEVLPEALWTCPIISLNGKKASRIGVNFHYEKNKTVMSIVNIQGKDKAAINELRESLKNAGMTPYWAVHSIDLLLKYAAAKVDLIRGLPSNMHPSKGRPGFSLKNTFPLYDMTFERLNFEKKYDLEGNLIYYEFSSQKQKL